MPVAVFCFVFTAVLGFLSLSIIDTWGQIFFSCETAHCRMFSSIAGLYPVDASSISPLGCDNHVSRHCQMPVVAVRGGSQKYTD